MFSATSNNLIEITFLQIIFVILILCQKNYSQERNWVFIGTDEKETLSAYIDPKPQKQSGENFLVWEKLVRADTNYVIGLVEWDCREKRSRIIQQTLYDKLGEPLDMSKKLDWVYTIDGTLGASIFKVVCQNVRQSISVLPSNQSKVILVEIVVTAASLRESPNINSKVIREIPKKERLMMANEKPKGNWFKIIDQKTQSEGWLYKSTFKVINSSKYELKKKVHKKLTFIQ